MPAIIVVSSLLLASAPTAGAVGWDADADADAPPSSLIADVSQESRVNQGRDERGRKGGREGGKQNPNQNVDVPRDRTLPHICTRRSIHPSIRLPAKIGEAAKASKKWASGKIIIHGRMDGWMDGYIYICNS